MCISIFGYVFHMKNQIHTKKRVISVSYQLLKFQQFFIASTSPVAIFEIWVWIIDSSSCSIDDGKTPQYPFFPVASCASCYLDFAWLCHLKSLSGDHYLTVGWWEWAGGQIWLEDFMVGSQEFFRNPGAWLPHPGLMLMPCLAAISVLGDRSVILSGLFIHSHSRGERGMMQ